MNRHEDVILYLHAITHRALTDDLVNEVVDVDVDRLMV